MQRSSLKVASIATLAFAFAGCGGGGASHAIPQPGPPISTTPLSPSSFSYGAELLRGASNAHAVSLGTVHLHAMLRLQNAAGLALYAQQVSDPHSSNYRRFLTPAQIGAQYGASTADYTAAQKYFASFGLRVGGWPQRIGVAISGPQSAVEAAFGTKLAAYTTPSGTIIGPTSTPHFSSSVPVVAVTNLVQAPASLKATLAPVSSPRGVGNNYAFGYTPQQIAFAFDFDGAYQAGFKGTGINIGIIGTNPVDPNDLAAYKSIFSWNATGTFTQVAATAQAAAGAYDNGVTGEGSPTATPPPVTSPSCTGPLPSCNPEAIQEAQLDTEQVLLAPGANTLFYLAYVPDECGTPSAPAGGTTGCGSTGGTPNPDYGPQIGLPEANDEIEQAIADDKADVLSLSYGGPEVLNAPLFTNSSGAYDATSFGAMEFHALAVEGIAVFVSSGDSGAQGCAPFAVGPYASLANANCVQWPSISDDVTAVGGVTTPLDNAGRFIGPITGWGLQTNQGAGATGGGLAALVPMPPWQTGPGVLGTTRNVPDVSLEGDSLTGVAVIANAQWGFVGSTAIGGTSVAAPEMAAMWALVLQACQQTASCHGPNGTYRLGNAAPYLYQIYNNATAYPTTFYDVTFGNNGVTPCIQLGPGACPNPLPTPDPGLNAGIGYDRVTGIGVPFARHLIKAVVGV